MTRDFLSLINAPAPPGMLAGNALATIDTKPKRKQIIGWRGKNGELRGLSDAAHDWNTLGKMAAATAIAGTATAIRAGHVAVSEVEYSRAQLMQTCATMQAQRDGLAAELAMVRAELAIVRAEKAAARPRRKWTEPARAFLTDAVRDLGRSSADCRAIAVLMAAKFGGTWTGPAVRAQVRRMGL